MASKVEKDKVDPKALFTAYQTTEDAVQAAKHALEQAMDRRTVACKAILDSLGAGPFSWKGRIVKVGSRSTKNEGGEVVSTSYFMKSQTPEDVQTI